MEGDQGQQQDGFEGNARNPTSDLFGKLDDELPQVRINSDALLEVKRKAAANDMTLSEYIRTRLYVDVFGLDHVLSLHEQRIRRATGNAVQPASGGA